MASPTKRKADDLEIVVNGSRNKRVRTQTPPKVSGELDAKVSSPIADEKRAQDSSQPLPATARKRAAKKKRRKVKEEGQTHEESNLANGQPDKVISGELAAKSPEGGKKRGRRKRSRQKEAVIKQSPPWEITNPTGGALLDLNPVFSHDEQYCLLAYDSNIAVYSVSTKLLVRTLSTSRKGYITGYSIPPEEQSQLVVSLSNGFIEKWDWQDGNKISTFDTRSTIANLALSTGESQSLVYTVEQHRKHWTIAAHGLRKGEKGELHSLYKSQEPISHIRVLDKGRFIVASAGKRLIVGSIEESSDSASNGILYTWRELECHEWISCLDVRLTQGVATNEGKRRKSAQSNIPLSIDVVVGGFEGSLWVYRDLSGRFLDNELGKGKGPIVPQRLHWHRNAVGAVRWAVDGNYLISGGNETVLLRWQLDTGKSTKLPHLSAPIESIVVSPSETLYGVRFSNNNAMVLSSAELEPIVDVPGPRIRIRRKVMIEPPKTSHVSSRSKKEQSFWQSNTRAAAAIIPDPGRLLLAVPGASPSRAGLPISSNAPFLQTLEIRDGSHLSLQALARTNTTVKTTGPEMNIITEPNVVLMQVSQDGQWLATVDEWIPPSIDFERLSLNQNDLARQQLLHMEVHLKLWSKAAKDDTWELVSRIVNPHMRNDGESATPEKVLDLVPDHSFLGFITIGTDAQVRVWRAKRRFRDGQEVHAQDGTPLTSWYCESSLSLPIAKTPDSSDMNFIVGRLACSSDSSLIAAAYQAKSYSDPTLHLLSASPLEIHSSLPDLITSNLKAIALLSQYLILLSDTLCVYDIVNSSTRFVFEVASASKLSENHAPSSVLDFTHLAVDYSSNTFAVVTPELKDAGADTGSRLAVFDPTQPEPLFTADFKHGTFALLPLSGLEQRGKGGYVILDSAASIRHVKPKARELLMSDVKTPKPKQKRLAGLESLFEVRDNESKALTVANGMGHGTSEAAADVMELDGDETPFVRAHQLKEALDVGSLYNLPRVENLFDKVAGLYISRPTD